MSTKGVQYQTRRGDMLDWICHQHYGQRPKAVEAVLEANPGLARHGPILPEGLVIQLPDLGPAEQKNRIRLWD
ncbi:tail protein X [Vibrio cholerae]|uniref:tail protein X n=1 Tax=Vibrio TaxID=662 RepID=UPI0018ACD09B|nr:MULTISPECIES: tail protein X [Vibrio]ELJ8564009.1 tail protein X [Vibrio cholerae]MBY4642184.1 tail protein X [Vibrio cholerae]MCR9658456.1 tail protein X [Vibrio cholerae]MCR9689138.1 tail protein X [Vibrio cholerae]MCR9746469.1 tail protein X [Vibrio cholerae]